MVEGKLNYEGKLILYFNIEMQQGDVVVQIKNENQLYIITKKINKNKFLIRKNNQFEDEPIQVDESEILKVVIRFSTTLSNKGHVIF